MVYNLIAVYVLLIAVVVIASSRFAQLAVAKGYSASKAKKYPKVIGAATFFLMMFGQTILGFLAGVTPSAGAIILGWSIFVLGLFLFILYRAYKNMQAAPEAGQPVEVDIETTEPNHE